MSDQAEQEKLLAAYGAIAHASVEGADNKEISSPTKLPGNTVGKRARSRTSSICSSHTDVEKKESVMNAIQKFSTPIKVTFSNLSFTVKVPTTRDERKLRPEKTKDLEILKKCTGYALPGQTCYIMGASGAGKTSLLNAISDRIAVKKGTTLEGEVLLNDK